MSSPSLASFENSLKKNYRKALSNASTSLIFGFLSLFKVSYSIVISPLSLIKLKFAVDFLVNTSCLKNQLFRRKTVLFCFVESFASINRFKLTILLINYALKKQ